MSLYTKNARRELLQLISNKIDQSLESRYALIIPTVCDSQDTTTEMMKFVKNFRFHARQLSEAQVLRTTVNVDVKFDTQKKIVSTLDVFAVIQTVNFKGEIHAKDWQSYVSGVVDRLDKSINSTHGSALVIGGARPSKKAMFQVMNKMVGNEALLRVSADIELAVNEARTQAMRDNIREEMVQSFRDKHRVKYRSDLAAYMAKNIPPTLLDEEDFNSVWREFFVSVIMDS